MNTMMVDGLAGWLPQMLGAGVNSILLLGAAALLLLLWRRGAASERHYAWLVALGGVLLLPVAPKLDLPVERLSWGHENPVTNFVVTNFVLQSSLDHQTNEPVLAGGLLKIPPSEWLPEAPPTPATGPIRFQPRFGLGWIWLAGSGVLLTVLGMGCWQRLQLRRRARICQAPALVTVLRVECANLHLKRIPVLLISPDAVMPMTWGAWKPVILLPELALHWSIDQLRMVLRHELGHIQRWDSLSQGMAQLLRALFWFNPLVWLACRRLRWERERACDDLVVRGGARPSEYAACLLAMARRLAVPLGATSLPAARRSGLERRLLAILNPVQPRHSLRPVVALGLVVVYSVGILFCFGPESRRPEVPSHDSLQLRLSQTSGFKRPDKRYLDAGATAVASERLVLRTKPAQPAECGGTFPYTFKMDKAGRSLPV